MIRVSLNGCVRLYDGDDHRLEVHQLLRVCAGDQLLPVHDRFGDTYVYEMHPGMFYNVLKPEAHGRTITRFIAATVMIDYDGKAWVGAPSERRPIRKGDPTAWNRILDEDNL